MKSDFIAQIDEQLAGRRSSRYKIEKIRDLNRSIANQVNSFMARTLISYTLLGMSLLLILFYIEGYIFPPPGIVIEISIAFVLLPVISVAVYVISLVGEHNWEHKKSIFGFIPTFSKKKKAFLENDAEVKKDIKYLSELTAKPDVDKLKASAKRMADKRRKTAHRRHATPGTHDNKVRIPGKYTTESTLVKLRGYITDGRADDLKEAINLYEQEKAFMKKEEAIESQTQEIEDLQRTIDSMNRDEAIRTEALRRQRAQHEHKIRKSIDDLKHYK